jgi:hypothetical protein
MKKIIKRIVLLAITNVIGKLILKENLHRVYLIIEIVKGTGNLNLRYPSLKVIATSGQFAEFKHN